MSNDTFSTLIVRYQLDDASVTEATAANDALESALKSQQETVSGIGDAAQDTAKKLDNAFDRQSGIKNATNDARQLTNEIDEASLAARNFNDEFDRVSRDVSLAGDVQSNLGAISGLAGAAGFSGGAQAIGVAGEITALTEELPRLKTAIAGMPGVISSAVSALGGIGGVGLIGALGAVTIGTIAFIDALNRSRAARAEEAREILELRAEEAIASGQGLDAIRGLRDQRRQELDDINSQIAGLEDFAEAVRSLDAAGSIQDIVADPGTYQELTASVVAELEELNLTSQDGATTLQTYNELLDQRSVAEQDLASAQANVTRLLVEEGKAREILNDAISKSIELAGEMEVAEAELIRQRELERAQLEQLSSDALQERVNSLQMEADAITAARDALVASGNTSDAVTAQIEAYDEQLQDLNGTIGFITDDLIANAERAEAATDAVGFLKDAIGGIPDIVDGAVSDFSDGLQEMQAELQKAEDAARKQAAAMDKLADNLERDLSKINDSLTQDLADAEMQRARDRIQFVIDTQREEAAALRNHADNLAKIQRSANAREEDLRLNRDFKAAFQLRKSTENQLKEAETSRKEEERERDIRRREQADDEQRAFAQQLADRRLAANRERAAARQAYQAQLADLQAAESAKINLLGQSIGVQIQTQAAGEQQIAAIRNSGISAAIQGEQQLAAQRAAAFGAAIGGIIGNLAQNVQVPQGVQNFSNTAGNALSQLAGLVR